MPRIWIGLLAVTLCAAGMQGAGRTAAGQAPLPIPAGNSAHAGQQAHFGYYTPPGPARAASDCGCCTASARRPLIPTAGQHPPGHHVQRAAAGPPTVAYGPGDYGLGHAAASSRELAVGHTESFWQHLTRRTESTWRWMTPGWSQRELHR